VSEVTPDPVYDKLARFSPDSQRLDPAEILFRAGRASARTHWFWKLAVAALLLTNMAAVGLLAFRDHSGPTAPEVVTVPVVIPVVVVPVEPVSSPPESASPWSYGSLLRTTDPDDLPRSPALVGMTPSAPPLTPLSRREID
jgi:hypothetical protein